MTVGVVIAIVLKDNTTFNIKYLLGILNSSMMNWYYGFIGKPKGKAREYFNEPLSIIPIINTADKSKHDKMVSLVDQMLDAKKKQMASTTERDKSFWENKCSSLDRQIDSLVYELYGLTEEEIKIVEGG